MSRRFSASYGALWDTVEAPHGVLTGPVRYFVRKYCLNSADARAAFGGSSADDRTDIVRLLKTLTFWAMPERCPSDDRAAAAQAPLGHRTMLCPLV